MQKPCKPVPPVFTTLQNVKTFIRPLWK